MLKNEQLLKLPRAPKPTLALRDAQKKAKAHTTPGVLCTRVHETRDGPVLAVDLWVCERGATAGRSPGGEASNTGRARPATTPGGSAKGGMEVNADKPWAGDTLQAREFFDGAKRRVFLALDGETTTKGLFKASVCHTFVWAHKADGARVETFFNVPKGRTQSAEELLDLVEHGKRLPSGTFTASGAGDAGGYRAEELTSPLPKDWQAQMIAGGFTPPHVLLVVLEWVRDQLTGLKERMDKCQCSACGAQWYESRGVYQKDDRTRCPECGAECLVKRRHRGRLAYEATGSLLWFHKYKDTAVAQGYEIDYWVDDEGKEHWHATYANIYAWGPYGNYAYNCYYTWGMGHQREYLDAWYVQNKMVDNWPRGYPVLLVPQAGALAGTPLENMRLRAYALAANAGKVRCLYPVRLATISRRLPVLEGFCDFGDWDTILGICNGQVRLQRGETKPHRALGLTRPEYDRYRAEGWSWDWLPAYLAAKQSGWTPDKDELLDLLRVMRYKDCMQEIERFEPGRLGQVWSYLNRVVRREFAKMCCGKAAVTQEEAKRKTLTTWLDYRKMAAELAALSKDGEPGLGKQGPCKGRPQTGESPASGNGLLLELDMTDKDTAMPYDLFRRHDRLVEAQRRRRQEEQVKREAAKAGKFTAMWKKICWADWQDGPYLIRAAKSTAELVAEGAALHHCVGSYTDSMLAGRVIFFIRRAAEPDKPWYTLNLDIKTGRLIQLHGYGNSESSDPEFAAVQAWAERWRVEVWLVGKKKQKTGGKAA